MSPILGGRGAGVRAYGFGGAGAPNQVTGLSTTDVGSGRAYNNGRIDLSWTAPANNGAPITGYKIERSTDNSTFTTLVADTGSTSTSYSNTSLTSSQIYYYKVSAINTVGVGLASSVSSATATTVPQAPTIGTATSGAAGSGQMSVAFSAGATGGSSITSYTVTSSPGSVTGTGSSSAITVSGLTPGTNYTFIVIATNANGTSTASGSSNSVTAAEIPKAAYAVAGYNSSGPTQNYDGMKLLQSNETISIFGYFDNNQQSKGQANSGVAGYAAGGIGFSSDQKKTIIVRTNFSDDGTYVASNFPTGRHSVSGIPNTGSFGYWFGGETTSSTFHRDYYKLTYSNDSLATLSNVSVDVQNHAAGLENKGVAGYSAGGRENTGKFGAASARILKVNYSTDVMTQLSITLSSALDRAYDLNNSGTAGYIVGANYNADKITYSTETRTLISSVWNPGSTITFQEGVATGIRGIAGYLWRGSGANTTHKFTYSTETGNTLAATYASTKTSMGGFANGGSY